MRKGDKEVQTTRVNVGSCGGAGCCCGCGRFHCCCCCCCCIYLSGTWWMAKSQLGCIPVFPLFFSTSFYPRPCGNSLWILSACWSDTTVFLMIRRVCQSDWNLIDLNWWLNLQKIPSKTCASLWKRMSYSREITLPFSLSRLSQTWYSHIFRPQGFTKHRVVKIATGERNKSNKLNCWFECGSLIHHRYCSLVMFMDC